MTFPSGDNQLFLLPARTAQEASAWGSAAMEYAAAFRPVHFSRDPSRVDWRGYQHVTLVRPSFWPDDLLLQIKQANPALIVDRLPVESPEALQIVLNLRVYYGWRYGPQTAFEWQQLWPPGKCLIGLHGRADGALQEADYPVIQSARVEAVKLTSHATVDNLARLRAINPDMFIMVRLFAAGSTNGTPNTMNPDTFVFDAQYTYRPLYDADPLVRYVEVHNEPNLRLEGQGGGGWRDGKEFGDWFAEVVARLRVSFPDCKFGFPGLSPGPEGGFAGRSSQRRFLEQAADAIQASADWVGVHSYWVNEGEMFDRELGFGFFTYRQLFPEKLLFVTEFGNPAQPRPVVADQYARYYGMLRNVKGLGGAFGYVLSASDAAARDWVWRDEAGSDLGIAPVVGRRQYIRDAEPAAHEPVG